MASSRKTRRERQPVSSAANKKPSRKRPEHKRRLATANRTAFIAMRRIASLRLADLRPHLATRLRMLWPWDPEAAASWLDQLGLVEAPPPESENFWSVLTAADAHEARGGDVREFLTARLRVRRRRFKRGRDTSRSGRMAAQQLMVLRDSYLRLNARQWITHHSRERERVWNEGHAQCPLRDQRAQWEASHQCGLTGMVLADGVEEPWVRDAIRNLRIQQVEGTPRQREAATTILEAVAAVLWKLGRGGTATLSPEERKQRRQSSTNRTKTATRAVGAAKRERKTLPGPESLESAAKRILGDRTWSRPPDERAELLRALERQLKKPRRVPRAKT